MGIPQIFTLSPLTQDDWEQFGSIHTKKKRTKYLIYKYLVLFSCTQTRGRTGMDFTPLVFETSASTDSAIWAFLFECVAKIRFFLGFATFFWGKYSKKACLTHFKGLLRGLWQKKTILA